MRHGLGISDDLLLHSEKGSQNGASERGSRELRMGKFFRHWQPKTLEFPRLYGRHTSRRVHEGHVCGDTASDPCRTKRKPAIRANALRGLSVLVVDDNPDARAILGAWFDHLGCVVVTVESAVEAVSMCRLAGPDIVLTDISMPHHDGYWLLRVLRALDEGQQERVPVVAMSAYRASRDVPWRSVRASMGGCRSRSMSTNSRPW
jgi:CheY-like chemotaxis protein